MAGRARRLHPGKSSPQPGPKWPPPTPAASPILLTVFHKTRMRDGREIDRARRALARCIDDAHQVVNEED